LLNIFTDLSFGKLRAGLGFDVIENS